MNVTTTEIPKDAALQLCAEIQRQYTRKWWTLTGMQCLGCIAATRGDQAKMCVSNAPGYRGCHLVNTRYDRRPA